MNNENFERWLEQLLKEVEIAQALAVANQYF
jgi:hypothetical protein